MADTRRYWDGQRWTDHVTPTAAQPPKQGLSALSVAAGVVLGVVILVIAGWTIYELVYADDEMQCHTRNGQRLLDDDDAVLEDCD